MNLIADAICVFTQCLCLWVGLLGAPVLFQHAKDVLQIFLTWTSFQKNASVYLNVLIEKMS